MTFAAALRERRYAHGLSLADLAEQVHFHRGFIHRVETGERAPNRNLAESADVALQAGGALVRAFEEDESVRQDEAATRRALASSLATTRSLVELADLELDEVHEGVNETAVDYLGWPPAPMLQRADALRSDVLQRLRDYRHGPHERADLYVAAGRLSGILAYAALDLGDSDAALQHSRAAARCARYAGDMELLVWVRGTQSLISRFNGDYGVALDYVRDGMQHVTEGVGTGEARLLCGEAQCLANLGDSRAANQTLNAAERARERVHRPDSIVGLFEFSETKQRYYAGSSLIWLDGGDDARRAAAEAQGAIDSWQAMPAEQRSLDDERLAHIYKATALVQLDDVEGAAEAMAPILALPREAQISWISKRAARIGSMLSTPRFQDSPAAIDLREAIAALKTA
ncbi:helix-turn-helix domain-containing protein [Streptomyces sp. LRE541]|uniref:helix-turn-helix transcriptional regulator n=1 Tax=Streptomyces sp. LRE541 TaxID=2931983 RepID=UPI00200BCE7D|nr:helix-turn-helix transcriptional regulator [Streptomyces sp. LRE541]UPZ27684.1 helix-turn-helix domain-containing protein [Streptomyces sp. LRE541]